MPERDAFLGAFDWGANIWLHDLSCTLADALRRDVGEVRQFTVERGGGDKGDGWIIKRHPPRTEDGFEIRIYNSGALEKIVCYSWRPFLGLHEGEAGYQLVWHRCVADSIKRH